MTYKQAAIRVNRVRELLTALDELTSREEYGLSKRAADDIYVCLKHYQKILNSYVEKVIQELIDEGDIKPW